jgi:hypothetical protein
LFGVKNENIKISMTVDEFADILRGQGVRVIHASLYTWDSPRGYRAEIEYHRRWYWYSVSPALKPVSPAEVGFAITSPARRVERCGPYKNGRGFEATVWVGDHCYRFGHGDDENR